MTRARIVVLLLIVCLSVAGAAGAVWYQRHLKYTLSVHKVSEGAYVLVGSGINATAVVTDEGVILVDTLPDGWWGPALESALRSITDKPVIAIINTNAHPGHSGNNPRFGLGTVEIVSHEATKGYLEKTERFQGENARYLPRTTFRDHLSLVRGKERIELYYFGPANTNGDAWVVFPSRRLMHIGDIVKKNDVPEYVRRFGGSGVTQPDTLARGMAALKDIDTVIVGHAYGDDPHPTLTWSELELHRRRSDQLLTAVREAMKSDRTLEEVSAIIRGNEAFKGFEPKRVNDAVEAIYSELVANRTRTSRLHLGSFALRAAF
jgi:glyoxylase-like metal-dependent hydrolase (beta-lactamase superfamily II)